MLEIQEHIDVWVLFTKSGLQPISFFWHGRQIKVEKINLIHSAKSGANTFYYFSVSCEDNFYRLKFDTNKLSWTLEAIEEV